MKMIYVASLATSPDRDSGWIDAFARLGYEVIPFCSEPKGDKAGVLGRVCKRLNIGRANKQMQQDLIALAEREQPAWIHFRLPIGFDRRTITELGNRKILLTQYFNDDPFSKHSPFALHWKFLHALTAYDGHFVYRAHNVAKYQEAGATHVEHCPPTYDTRRHFLSISASTSNSFLADAAFIGHWENDWRADCLDALVKSGFSVILKGGMWDRAIRNRPIGKLAPVTHAFGEEYNHIYANVTAGLCFFSKINNDPWTERALEIVAVGGVLVCERTEEAQSYFKNGEEAYFFSSIEELLEIVGELRNNPAGREKVRLAGHKRLLAGKNTVLDRATQIVKFVTSMQGSAS